MVLCIFPMIHVLAISLSSINAVDSGQVFLLPVGINFEAYKFVIRKVQFIRSFFVSIQRVLLGVTLNMLMTILVAYPLSKPVYKFPRRTLYAWIFFITMLFGGGLIPTYLVVYKTSLINSIWALVIPGAVPVFNIIIMINFFRDIPESYEDAAYIDGAGHLRILYNVYLPMSLPALATLILFSIVGHWNRWFDGMIYMNSPAKYPLQSYLRTLVITLDVEIMQIDEVLQFVNNRTQRAAQIFVGMLPVLMIYPFLQRYFVKGIRMGGLKE